MTTRTAGKPIVLGIDIGTTNSKGLACTPDGSVVARAERAHAVDRPAPGLVEHDAEATWWGDTVAIARELVQAVGAPDRIRGLAVTTCGPCLVPVDDGGRALRPGILYGIDTRTTSEVARLEATIGAAAIRRLGGMELSSQSLGPKIAWIARHEPDVARRVATWHTATSYVVRRLTGVDVIDHHQASYAGPLYDARRHAWDHRHAGVVGLTGRWPALGWPGDIAGGVTDAAATATGLPIGLPVLVGTSDGPMEALALGALTPGTLALTHGSTTTATVFARPAGLATGLWVTDGWSPDRPCVGAGLSASGLVLDWMVELLAPDEPIEAARAVILREAAAAPVGANGVLVVSSLAGQRTPVADPGARGTIAGLTLAHRRGDVARAVVEGLAYASADLLRAFAVAGIPIERVRTAGGATRHELFVQVIADVTGQAQEIATEASGAAHGAARLAADAVGLGAPDADWFRPARRIEPDPAAHAVYAARQAIHRQLARDVRAANRRLAGVLPA